MADLAYHPAITLEETNKLAANQRRTDRKYLLTSKEADRFMRAHNNLPLLTIDGRQSFTYLTTYYDTPDLNTYRLAVQGHRNKHKVRTRMYDTGEQLLELKKKEKGQTVKIRIPYSDDELNEDAAEFIADQLAYCKEGYASELKSVLTVIYQRQTLVDVKSNVRVTIDRGLEFARNGEHNLFLKDFHILETKTPTVKPSGIDRWLWANSRRPQSISKYALGIANYYDLPANKWSKTMKQISPQFTKIAAAV